jgi:hypothetical protein
LAKTTTGKGQRAKGQQIKQTKHKQKDTPPLCTEKTRLDKRNKRHQTSTITVDTYSRPTPSDRG